MLTPLKPEEYFDNKVARRWSEKVHSSVTRWQGIDLFHSQAQYFPFDADRLAFCQQLRPYHRKLKLIWRIHSVCSHICKWGRCLTVALVVLGTHTAHRNLVQRLFVAAYIKRWKETVLCPLHTIRHFDNTNFVVYYLMAALWTFILNCTLYLRAQLVPCRKHTPSLL